MLNIQEKTGVNVLRCNECSDCTIKLLISLKQIIFNLSEENFDFSLQNTIKLFDANFPHSYNLVINNLVYYAFYSKKTLNIDLYIDYLESIQNKEEEIYKKKLKIIKSFGNYLIKTQEFRQEAYYLIEKMIERNLLNKNITKNLGLDYFVHYKKEIYRKPNFDMYLKENYEELSKNDFAIHKKLIKEGVNPYEIAKIIRNDEIEKLQEISSQTNFDYNQTIPKSHYERYSFINSENVTLIDYAAFFSSIKCFKYLLINGSDIGDTGKYAVAGGNEELIHLCEQNNSSFNYAYETAIEFHRNDIFKYLYENNLGKYPYLHDGEEILDELGKKCITSFNIEALLYLKEHGMEINGIIINEAAITGNIYLIKHFLQNNQIPRNILVFATGSRNIEPVKYILEQKGIDINAKNIYLFYLEFILII